MGLLKKSFYDRLIILNLSYICTQNINLTNSIVHKELGYLKSRLKDFIRQNI